jgi:predicted DNA-binding transcriptional regulator AlpA
MEKLITLQQLCDKTLLSRSTIDRWRKEGLPCSKMGRGLRFNEKGAIEWIKQNKQNG